MNKNEKIIRDLIKKESLRIINKSQASFLKENSVGAEKVIQDIDESIIDVNEKRMDKLKKEEDSAREKEDFFELKRVKEDQVFSIDKLIKGYLKKAELLNNIKQEIKEDLIQIQKKGAGVFNNQEMLEFSNEKFNKDWALRIETENYYLNLVKILDNNAYRVVDTNIEGLMKGDLLKLPDLKVGGSGDVEVYREVGGRHENITSFNIKNVKKMIKNPQ